jgi:exonuclease I
VKAWLAPLARHPVISGVLVACTLAGGVAGILWLDADWSVARRLLAGAVGGAWVGLLFTATKMVGR